MLTFSPYQIRSDEALTLETSVLVSLYGGQMSSSTSTLQFDKTKPPVKQELPLMCREKFTIILSYLLRIIMTNKLELLLRCFVPGLFVSSIVESFPCVCVCVCVCFFFS